MLFLWQCFYYLFYIKMTWKKFGRKKVLSHWAFTLKRVLLFLGHYVVYIH